MENSKEYLASLRQDCWNQALHAFGTAYIFERRAKKIGSKLKILTFLGIAVPLSVGALVLSWGADSKAIPYITFLAGILGFVQLILSVWAIVAKWQDNYTYSQESTSSNYRLANKYELLAKYQSDDEKEQRINFDLLATESSARDDLDIKQGISEKEKRRGMRAALRKYKRECANCKLVPMSLEPSDCPVCGNF